MSEKSTISTGPEGSEGRDDAPRLTREMAERAELAIGGKVIREAMPPLGRRRGRPPKPEGERKEAVSLRLDPDVLAWFRAGGEGWQTRINEALADYIGRGGRGAARVAEERAGYGAAHEAAVGGTAKPKPPPRHKPRMKWEKPKAKRMDADDAEMGEATSVLERLAS